MMIEEELVRRLETLRSEGRLLDGAAPGEPNALRHGDASGYGLLLRHRELLAYNRPPRGRRASPTLLNYFRGTSCSLWTSRTSPLPQCAGMFEGDRSRKSSWWSTASVCPRRSTTGRSTSRSFERIIDRAVFVSATPAEYELSVSAQVVEQVIGRRGLSIRRSRCARPQPGGRPHRRGARPRGEERARGW
jgi:excinuclease ABC subunit B